MRIGIVICCLQLLLLAGCEAPDGEAELGPGDDGSTVVDLGVIGELDSVFASIERDSENERPLPDVAHALETVRTFGEPWSIGIVSIDLSQDPDEDSTGSGRSAVLVYLSGGPLAPTLDITGLRRIVRTYGDSIQSIVAIQYSASVETQAVNLLEHKFAAFDRDSDAVIAYLTELKQQDENVRIILHAESLSGLLAMRIIERAPQLVDISVLQSPWTHYLSSSEFIASPFSIFDRGEFETRPASAAELKSRYRQTVSQFFDIDESKPTDPGREWMKSVRDNADFSKEPVAVLYGEYEDRVPLDEAIQFFESRRARVFLASGQFHSTVLTSDVERQFVQEFLRQSSNE